MMFHNHDFVALFIWANGAYIMMTKKQLMSISLRNGQLICAFVDGFPEKSVFPHPIYALLFLKMN
jgi:hypothetical protein